MYLDRISIANTRVQGFTSQKKRANDKILISISHESCLRAYEVSRHLPDCLMPLYKYTDELYCKPPTTLPKSTHGDNAGPKAESKILGSGFSIAIVFAASGVRARRIDLLRNQSLFHRQHHQHHKVQGDIIWTGLYAAEHFHRGQKEERGKRKEESGKWKVESGKWKVSAY